MFKRTDEERHDGVCCAVLSCAATHTWWWPTPPRPSKVSACAVLNCTRGIIAGQLLTPRCFFQCVYPLEWQVECTHAILCLTTRDRSCTYIVVETLTAHLFATEHEIVKAPLGRGWLGLMRRSFGWRRTRGFGEALAGSGWSRNLCRPPNQP